MNHRESSSLSRDDLLRQLTELRRDNRELRARLGEPGAQSPAGAAPADAQDAGPRHGLSALEASEGWLRALV